MNGTRHYIAGQILSLSGGELTLTLFWCWEIRKQQKGWQSSSTYTTKEGGRVGCLAQTGFAAFGKGVQLVSGCPYAEQHSRLTSISGILATS